MDQQVTTLFYPRKPKNYVRGNDIPVYMRITVKKGDCPVEDKAEPVPANRLIPANGVQNPNGSTAAPTWSKL